ncbi:MAG TPA: two-component regulator propeller domain-containing protein [Gemmatimonadota bacterium]
MTRRGAALRRRSRPALRVRRHPALGIRSLSTLGALLLATALPFRPASGQHPPVTGFYAEGDWLTLADFRHVTALAAGDQDAYVGTTAGVGVLSGFGGGWSRTVTAGDGLPSPVVTALAFDAAGGRLWIGTAQGVAVYDPFRGEVVQDPPGLGTDAIRDLRSESSLSGSPPAGGSGHVFVRNSSGWYRVDTFSMRAELVSSGEVPPAEAGVDARSLPFLAGDVVRGERSGQRESFRVTGAVALADRSVVLGTWGAGVYVYDVARLSPEPAPFGLAGPGGGPIARDGRRLWFSSPAGALVPGTLPAASDVVDRPALARTGPDLRAWGYDYPGLEPALPSDRVYDIASSGERTLFATDAGLALYDAVAERWIRLSVLTGGPAEVLAVEGAADGFWLGTRAGLVALRTPADTTGTADSLKPAGRWLEGRTVTALASDGRELYAATDLGLYRLAPRAPGSVEWTLTQMETVGRTIRDVALAPDAVVAATDRGVEILPRGEGEPLRFLTGESQLDELPLAVAADLSNVWIATRAGVARWDRQRKLWNEYGLADGLPDLPVLHILVQDGRYVWFSTPGGATRFDVGDPPRAR